MHPTQNCDDRLIGRNGMREVYVMVELQPAIRTRFWGGKGLLTALLLAVAFPAVAEWHVHDGQAMGTRISVEFWHESPETAQQVTAAVMAEMQRIDQQYSPWISTSELYRINQRAGEQPVPLSDELLFLLERSIFYGHLTQGAFDVTFASVGRLYDYRARQQPDAEQAQAMLPAVDYRQIKLDTRRKTVHFGHPDMQIDLGGIAKGYAVDRAIDIIHQHQIQHAVVSAGGDSRVLGDKRGRPWMIGIKKPRSLSADAEPAIALPLEEVAVSTSGDYERYFIDPTSGERIHHIINPDTGRSAQGPVSVTVIGRLGIDTDALSTSVFVLGVEQGLDLINNLPGFDCIIIDARGQVFYSNGLVDPTADAG